MLRVNNLIGFGNRRRVINADIVAGGGGGGRDDSGGAAGGGGAGGYLALRGFSITPGTYPIVVGAAGVLAANGSNSSAFGRTAIGGGRGGSDTSKAGGNGGSGGGPGDDGSAGTPGTGTPGQGFDGAVWGGGGADRAGFTGQTTNTSGVVSTITESSITYCRGAGPYATAPTEKGSGGIAMSSGVDGTVVATYPTGSLSATGGTITTSGGTTIHTFTSSGDFVVR